MNLDKKLIINKSNVPATGHISSDDLQAGYNSLIVDSTNRMIWNGGVPVAGNRYVKGLNDSGGEITNGPQHAEIFNDLANNKAEGNYSHAEGKSTESSGVASHAEGESTKSSGETSHAEGNSTKSGGIASHAEGTETNAIGNSSHAEGIGTITTNPGEHASGKYNISEANGDYSEGTLFSIGNGIDDTNRKNAFWINNDGNIYVNSDNAYNDPCHINDGETTRTLQYALVANADKLLSRTWKEMTELIKNSGLVTGMYYRITDYTGSIKNSASYQSANHQFDIIVLALDNKTLSEDAYAINHEDDTYFGSSKLNAWKLKYSLKNDTSRFEWASEKAITLKNNSVTFEQIQLNYISTLKTSESDYDYDYDEAVKHYSVHSTTEYEPIVSSGTDIDAYLYFGNQKGTNTDRKRVECMEISLQLSGTIFDRYLLTYNFGTQPNASGKEPIIYSSYNCEDSIGFKSYEADKNNYETLTGCYEGYMSNRAWITFLKCYTITEDNVLSEITDTTSTYYKVCDKIINLLFNNAYQPTSQSTAIDVNLSMLLLCGYNGEHRYSEGTNLELIYNPSTNQFAKKQDVYFDKYWIKYTPDTVGAYIVTEANKVEGYYCSDCSIGFGWLYDDSTTLSEDFTPYVSDIFSGGSYQICELPLNPSTVVYSYTNAGTQTTTANLFTSTTINYIDWLENVEAIKMTLRDNDSNEYKYVTAIDTFSEKLPLGDIVKIDNNKILNLIWVPLLDADKLNHDPGRNATLYIDLSNGAAEGETRETTRYYLEKSTDETEAYDFSKYIEHCGIPIFSDVYDNHTYTGAILDLRKITFDSLDELKDLFLNKVYALDTNNDDTIIYIADEATPEAETEIISTAKYASSNYITSTDNHGVIYYMQDEFNNVAYYDFKNIKFKKDDTDKWYYTFNIHDTDNDNCFDASVLRSTGSFLHAANNTIYPYYYFTANNYIYQYLNDIILNINTDEDNIYIINNIAFNGVHNKFVDSDGGNIMNTEWHADATIANIDLITAASLRQLNDQIISLTNRVSILEESGE